MPRSSPRPSAQQLLVTGGAVVGVRTGDKGLDRDGEPARRTTSPARTFAREPSVLAEGTQGHLTGVAIDHFGLHGESPQVWALGVKEVWRVAKPLKRVIHTMGWPLRGGRKYREFGGSFIYPMGDDMVTVGLVVGLDYRDADALGARPAPAAEDAPASCRDPRRAASGSPGARRRSPRAATSPLPRSRLARRASCSCGDGAGLVNVPALKGIHYAM